MFCVRLNDDYERRHSTEVIIYETLNKK